MGEKLNPRQAGYLLGRYLPHSMYVAEVSDIEAKVLHLFEITVETLLTEKLILSASAVLHAINRHVSELSVQEEIRAGFWDALKLDSMVSLHVRHLVSVDECVFAKYQEAAILDSTRQGQADGCAGLSEIEITYAERLVGEGEHEDEKLQELAHLVVEIPKILWVAQVNGVIATLGKEGLLKFH